MFIDNPNSYQPEFPPVYSQKNISNQALDRRIEKLEKEMQEIKELLNGMTNISELVQKINGSK